ncbi:MAG: VWA domain-containing protein [Alphaproteobacteria bacterium]|nr:VWA domain-containing protein [Alphaproteobacteria bacterium]
MTETGNGTTPGLALLEELEGNKLVTNIMHFGRVLRSAGLPVGPGKILDAVSAVQTVTVTNRRDFYWALHAVFVNRRDQHEIFDQAFHIFWRDPRLLERMLGLLMPQGPAEEDGPEPEPPSRRIAEAMSPGNDEGNEEQEEKEPELEVEATLTASANELLQKMDFEDMSADEIAKAKAAIARMRLTIQNVKTRRFQASHRIDKIDMRSTLRAAMRSGGSVIPLQYRTRRKRTPPLVILCDISGSMGRYTRMLLHFMHAITNDRDRVSTFLFGTRLTNVTRHLRNKDIDIALMKCTDSVEDWSGGTRIGDSLKDFNQFWSRRVLGQGAVMLLISDGLDRDAGRGLALEMERLHKSCRRLIWVNPLLRFEGFEPKSQGIRAILPHVDEFRPVHNLESLTELIEALNSQLVRRKEGITEWLQAM